MNYRGYEITAEVETYEQWAIDDDGNPTEFSGGGDTMETTGYFFYNEETGDVFFETVRQCNREELESFVDSHLLELKNEGSK